MCWPRRLWNDEDRGRAGEEGEGDLSRRRAMGRRDLGQHSSRRSARGREVILTEGTIADEGHAVLLAPGEDGMLYRPLLEVVEHLVADQTFTGDRTCFLEIVDIEIADAPGEDLP